MKMDGTDIRDAKNMYISDDCFMSDLYNYERDTYNGRCYRLEESYNLRPEMGGALVRRRIGKKEYEAALNHCLAEIEKYEAFLRRIK